MGKVKTIMDTDLKHCYVCGDVRNLEIHHVIHGYANRKWADKYHLVVSLCHSCHRRVHDVDVELDRFLEGEGQKAFEKEHPDLDFKKIFGKNFILEGDNNE